MNVQLPSKQRHPGIAERVACRLAKQNAIDLGKETLELLFVWSAENEDANSLRWREPHVVEIVAVER